MQLTRQQLQIARNTFAQFAARNGQMTVPQARYEFDEFLMSTVFQPATRDQYRMRRRVGAAFTMNRAQRDEIFMTFENAINHATF